MPQVTLRLLILFIALVLASCSADDATRSNTFLELTAIIITSDYDSIANLTDNQFTATGDYSGEFPTDITTEVTWSSSDTGILTISNAAGSEGLATAIAPGPVTVTATSGDISEDFPFTVSNASIDTLTVSPAMQSAPIGVERDFDAIGYFNDGTNQNLDRIASWSSLDPLVAGVTGNGSAIGLSVGTADILAKWQGVTGTATLSVEDAVLTDLTITPADAEYPVGLIVQYELTGIYSDGSTDDLTAQAFWESDNETRATVDNTAGEEGKVEMSSSGSTDIIASYTDLLTGDWEPSTSLYVNNTTLREILITATVFAANGDIVSQDIEIEADDALDIYNDETVHFTAKGEYTDNAEYDITTQTTWASSDTAIVTISNSSGFEGIATPGNETGEADINVAFDDLDITFTLDVIQR